jgi:hypothetical protein
MKYPMIFLVFLFCFSSGHAASIDDVVSEVRSALSTMSDEGHLDPIKFPDGSFRSLKTANGDATVIEALFRVLDNDDELAPHALKILLSGEFNNKEKIIKGVCEYFTETSHKLASIQSEAPEYEMKTQKFVVAANIALASRESEISLHFMEILTNQKSGFATAFNGVAYEELLSNWAHSNNPELAELARTAETKQMERSGDSNYINLFKAVVEEGDIRHVSALRSLFEILQSQDRELLAKESGRALKSLERRLNGSSKRASSAEENHREESSQNDGNSSRIMHNLFTQYHRILICIAVAAVGISIFVIRKSRIRI